MKLLCRAPRGVSRQVTRDPAVIARVFGGLGNQLFCYAAARRLALANDVPLRLDMRSGFLRGRYGREYLLDRFAIPCQQAGDWEAYLHPGGRARRYLERSLNRRLPYARRWYLQEETVHVFDLRLLGLRVARPVYLEGYWQSEHYFADVADIIRQDLQLARPPSGASQALAEQMRCEESVSVHLRSFAEVAPQARHPALSTAMGIDHYRRAAELITGWTGQPRFYLFSDDMGWAVQQFDAEMPIAPVDVNTGRGHDGAVDDLWLMSQCKHHIISNSTFSWWGAWLGDSENSRVVAPERMSEPIPDWVPARWEIV